MKGCVFCKIARREKAENIIYEDEDFLAFLDNKPINFGHILIIPRQHYDNISVMPEDLFKNYALLAKKLTPKLKEALNARWINLLVFGEQVKHAHIHLVPRFDNDNFRYPIQKEYKEGEAELIANKIKNKL